MYICPRCNYESDRKSSLKNHFSRKIACISINDDTSLEECINMLEKNLLKKNKNIICEYCELLFIKKKEYNDHLTKCYKKHMKKMEKKIDKLENQLNDNKSKIKTEIKTEINNSTININNIDNSVTTNNYIININSYENTDYGSIEDIYNCIDDAGNIIDVSKFIELVHFNEKHPENYNIYIANKKHKDIMILEGENFVRFGSNYSGLTNLYNKQLNAIDITDKYSDEMKILSDETHTQFNNKTFKEKNELLDKICNILYNKKELIIKNYAENRERKLLKKPNIQSVSEISDTKELN